MGEKRGLRLRDILTAGAGLPWLFCGWRFQVAWGLPGGWGCPLWAESVLEMPWDEETEVLRAGEPAGPVAAHRTFCCPCFGSKSRSHPVRSCLRPELKL